MTRLTFNPGNHSYYLADPDTGKKERLPAVSTLLNTLAKPALTQWAARVAAAYATDHWDELALQPLSARRAAIAAAAKVTKDTAAAKGTAVHALAERLLAGETVEVPDVIAGKVNHVARWLEAQQLTHVLTECRVWTEPDDDLRMCGYAGTADMIAAHPVYGRCILDWKTGSGPWPEKAIQLAAYATADHLVIGDQDTRMPRVDTLGVVMVRESGCELHLIPPDSQQAAAERFELLRMLRLIPEPYLRQEA
jgi:hypothetical protein